MHQRRRAGLTFTAVAVFWHSLLSEPWLLETTRLAAGQMHRGGAGGGAGFVHRGEAGGLKSDYVVYHNLEITKEKLDVFERLGLSDGEVWV